MILKNGFIYLLCQNQNFSTDRLAIHINITLRNDRYKTYIAIQSM